MPEPQLLQQRERPVPAWANAEPDARHKRDGPGPAVEDQRRALPLGGTSTYGPGVSGDTYAGFDEALSPVLCQEKSSSGGARSDDIGLTRFLLRSVSRSKTLTGPE